MLKAKADEKAILVLNADAIRSALSGFFGGFNDKPVAARRSLLTAILRVVKLKKDGVVLRIGNPGFDLGGLGGMALGCYPGGQELGHLKGWLLRTDSNRRPGD